MGQTAIPAVILKPGLRCRTLMKPFSLIRNAYQNYGVAVNTSNKTIYTYMGVLKPRMGNASYSTSGQLALC